MLLLAISCSLQATEHYIHAKQKQEACSIGDELRRSPYERAAAQGRGRASSLLHAHETAITELSEEVRESVVRRLRRTPILTISTSDDESDSDAETREPPRKRQSLKLGKVCTADSMVVKVTWPHELVYMAAGRPAVYQDLSVTLFVSGYLAVMDTVKPSLRPIMSKHLKELILDAEVHGWALVRAYHMVWLQQIVNGKAMKADTDGKPELCRALV